MTAECDAVAGAPFSWNDNFYKGLGGREISMGKEDWTLALKDGNHTVELKHGYFSGKIGLMV